MVTAELGVLRGTGSRSGGSSFSVLRGTTSTVSMLCIARIQKLRLFPLSFYCHSRHRYGAGPYRRAGNSGSLEEDNRDDHKTAEFLREIAGRATLQTHQIRPVLTRPRI